MDSFRADPAYGRQGSAKGRPPGPRRSPAPGLQQHDLEPAAAAQVVAASGVADGDRVLEVGPGQGALTAALLAAGARVAAVERDPARVALLTGRFAEARATGRLVLLAGDARFLHPLTAGPWRVVANPPFQHSAELVRRWLLDDLTGGPPDTLDLVLQAEAARKWCAGSASRSGVLARLFGRPRLMSGLPRTATHPASRVDLAHWRLERDPAAPTASRLRAVDRLLAVGLAGPHTLKDALRGLATAAMLRIVARNHHVDPKHHPRTVPAAAWLALADHLTGLGRL